MGAKVCRYVFVLLLLTFFGINEFIYDACSYRVGDNPYIYVVIETKECTRSKKAGGLCERRSIYDDLNYQQIWFTSCDYNFPYPHKTSLVVILGKLLINPVNLQTLFSVIPFKYSSFLLYYGK